MNNLAYEKQLHINRLVDRPNTYNFHQNEDGTVSIVPAWEQIAGTPVDEIRLNHIEDGIYNAHFLIEKASRRISRIEAHLDIDSRGVSGAQARFADTYDGQIDPVLQLDETKTYATVALSSSAFAVAISVASTTGFTVGQEVTICDDVAFENQTITAIGSGKITLSKLVNSYKKGAIIARSTVNRDTTVQKMRIGGWNTHTITITQA
ncbi:integrase [Brevibacillus laterosporus]|uniref:integrase n=1 Tax=Brevibacillus laterosporus TaxID=1465 RepID=UPI00241BF15B|nr:integrase [Brevibacillus laterosporus]MED1788505.1 integrase [Brevibacillus laterosporus]